MKRIIFIVLTLISIAPAGAQYAGKKDKVFGTAGQVKISLYNGYSTYTIGTAIDHNKKIVWVGYVKHLTTNMEEAILILRYNKNGTLDHTFSGDGIDTIRVNTY